MIAIFAFLLLLYILKGILFASGENIAKNYSLHFIIFVLCIPICWAVGPQLSDRTSSNLSRLIGSPVMILTIPVLSYGMDQYSKVAGKPFGNVARHLLELVLLTPLWCISCMFVEFVYLGWINE